jgi:hypothetical protein
LPCRLKNIATAGIKAIERDVVWMVSAFNTKHVSTKHVSELFVVVRL